VSPNEDQSFVQGAKEPWLKSDVPSLGKVILRVTSHLQNRRCRGISSSERAYHSIEIKLPWDSVSFRG
jgi:hypothetical protein